MLGTPEDSTIVVERLDRIDRVIPVGQCVRPRTRYGAEVAGSEYL
jgi:hypothetical protein